MNTDLKNRTQSATPSFVTLLPRDSSRPIVVQADLLRGLSVRGQDFVLGYERRCRPNESDGAAVRVEPFASVAIQVPGTSLVGTLSEQMSEVEVTHVKDLYLRKCQEYLAACLEGTLAGYGLNVESGAVSSEHSGFQRPSESPNVVRLVHHDEDGDAIDIVVRESLLRGLCVCPSDFHPLYPEDDSDAEDDDECHMQAGAGVRIVLPITGLCLWLEVRSDDTVSSGTDPRIAEVYAVCRSQLEKWLCDRGVTIVDSLGQQEWLPWESPFSRALSSPWDKRKIEHRPGRDLP